MCCICVCACVCMYMDVCYMCACMHCMYMDVCCMCMEVCACVNVPPAFVTNSGVMFSVPGLGGRGWGWCQCGSMCVDVVCMSCA